MTLEAFKEAKGILASIDEINFMLERLERLTNEQRDLYVTVNVGNPVQVPERITELVLHDIRSEYEKQRSELEAAFAEL